jgi:hypothetical protein
VVASQAYDEEHGAEEKEHGAEEKHSLPVVV